MTRQHLWSLLGVCCFEYSRTSFLKLFHHFRVASAWWSYDLYTSPALFVAALVCQPQPESRNVMRGEHCVTLARELYMELDRLAYKSSSNYFLHKPEVRAVDFFKNVFCAKAKSELDRLSQSPSLLISGSGSWPQRRLVTNHFWLRQGFVLRAL